MLVLGALALLACGTNSDDVDGEALDLEASGKALGLGVQAEMLFADVRDAFALRADEVMVLVAVHFNAQRAVVRTDFLQDAAFEEEMDVLVDRCEGDGGDALLDARVDLFRAGVAGHGLHDVIQHLALMRGGKTVRGAEFAEGPGLAKRLG